MRKRERTQFHKHKQSFLIKWAINTESQDDAIFQTFSESTDSLVGKMPETNKPGIRNYWEFVVITSHELVEVRRRPYQIRASLKENSIFNEARISPLFFLFLFVLFSRLATGLLLIPPFECCGIVEPEPFALSSNWYFPIMSFLIRHLVSSWFGSWIHSCVWHRSAISLADGHWPSDRALQGFPDKSLVSVWPSTVFDRYCLGRLGQANPSASVGVKSPSKSL